MKYSDEELQPTTVKRLSVDECTPGQIYELVYMGDDSKPKPSVSRLRLCVNDENRNPSLCGLSDGVINGRFNGGDIKCYMHRPDIQLVIVGDDR